jgi:hypothetical protein
MVEAERTMPLHASGVPRFIKRGVKTEPLLDSVELRIMNPPIRQRLQKTAVPVFFVPKFIGSPA